MAGRTRWARLAPWALIVAAALLLIAATASPADARKRKRGIDVSRFQGVIDWVAVGETKNRFAFVQASRGSGRDCAVEPDRCGPDEYYLRNYVGATVNGLRVGPYHRAFASGSNRRRAKKDARREARVFTRAVGELADGDLIPVLDVETPFTQLNPSRLRLWIRVWLSRVERKLGARPMIYTNFSSWQATGDTQRFALAGYPLWVANFGVDSPAVPAADWAGASWSVWQFTSSGRVRGIAGNVDKNRLAVPLRRLRAAAPPPEPPEAEPEPE